MLKSLILVQGKSLLAGVKPQHGAIIIIYLFRQSARNIDVAPACDERCWFVVILFVTSQWEMLLFTLGIFKSL